MGRLWCAGFPIVTVPRSTVPKHVTLVYPYYENPEFLDVQIRQWSAYGSIPLHVVLVDDGSPDQPAADVLRRFRPDRLRLFRIEQDVRWNWLAARNIGAHEARDGWLLLTDMDHVVPPETVEAVIYGVHDTRIVYAFSRKEHTGEIVSPHSASFLMTRKLFWDIGGYDERLSGHYGTDGEYRRRVAQHANIQILTDFLIRYEYVGDSSTTRYKRKQPEDARVKQLIAQRTTSWTPKVLSFAYHEVSA